MKNRGGWNSYDFPSNVQYFLIAVQGAGASAPVAPPGVAYWGKNAAGTQVYDWHVKANALSRKASEVPTRTSAGVYVITYDYDFTVPIILDVPCDVYGTPGVWAQVSSWQPSTRQLTVNVFAAGGTPTDLAGSTTPDFLLMKVQARDTSPGSTGSPAT